MELVQKFMKPFFTHVSLVIVHICDRLFASAFVCSLILSLLSVPQTLPVILTSSSIPYFPSFSSAVLRLPFLPF